MTVKASVESVPVSSTRTLPHDESSIPIATASGVNDEERSVATTTVNDSASESETPAFFSVSAPVDKPDNMQSTTTNGKLVVQGKWQRPRINNFICVTVFLIGFIVYFNWFFLVTGLFAAVPILIFYDIFGLYLIYVSIFRLKNSISITVEGDFLTVRSPSRCIMTKTTFRTSDVREIRCKRDVSFDSRGRISPVSYDVPFFDPNRVEQVLVCDLLRLEEALFFAQELEKHLGLRRHSVI